MGAAYAPKGTAMAISSATAAADMRYSFTSQFLCSSAIFARRCAEIERINPDNPDELTRTEHRGLVTATIMQCSAAIEAESAEVLMHGPGSHLGSNGTDTSARDFLKPMAEFIDDQRVLERYKLILHILRKPPLAEGEQPWQGMALLLRVRNELVHYKSKWGAEMGREKLFKSIRQLGFSKPPFVTSHASFFPHQFLSAECAAWSVRTTVAFLDVFYERLGIGSPLKPYYSQFENL